MAMIRYALLDGEGSKATITLDGELSDHCHGVTSTPLLDCEGSNATLTLDGELTDHCHATNGETATPSRWRWE